MKWLVVLTAVAVVVLAAVVDLEDTVKESHSQKQDSTAASLPSKPKTQFPRQGGVNFLNGLWSPVKYGTHNSTLSLDSLVSETASNYVALSFASFQWSPFEVGPIYNLSWATPTYDQMRPFIAECYKRQIGVMVRPLVNLDYSNPANNASLWRGSIGETFNSSQWTKWFELYTDFIVPWAAFAEEVKAPQFCIGAELDATIYQSASWRGVAEAVRRVYSGQILYAANWGTELEIDWWSAVDIIGVDAYYPLAEYINNPTVAQLVEAWQPTVKELRELSAATNRSILFSETGYCSQPNCTFAPYGCSGDTYSGTAQANAFEALYLAFWEEDWWLGPLFWGWTTSINGSGGKGSVGYSPAGKPATQVMTLFNSLLDPVLPPAIDAHAAAHPPVAL